MGHRALTGTQISLELGQGAAEWSLLARAQMNSSKCQWWDVQGNPCRLQAHHRVPKHRENFHGLLSA